MTDSWEDLEDTPFRPEPSNGRDGDGGGDKSAGDDDKDATEWQLAAERGGVAGLAKAADEHERNQMLWAVANAESKDSTVQTHMSGWAGQVTVLKRPTTTTTTTTTMQNGSTAAFSADKLLAQREAEYEMARQRIFVVFGWAHDDDDTLASLTRMAATPAAAVERAAGIMCRFVERTSVAEQERYLWTDAFAVCNLLALARTTHQEQYRDMALRLINQVHRVLGQHRPDNRTHQGWLSGSALHPTAGGLRIGKALPERNIGEPLDDEVEWDRDGQYFHYLTKWMVALDQAARFTCDATYNRWARELASTAFRVFTYQPSSGTGPRRMYWKMSIDLARPLVVSMGHHDPLDGYITFMQLQATARQLRTDVNAGDDEPTLVNEVTELARMVAAGHDWATADPLGIGGLLTDAYRVLQLQRDGYQSDLEGLVAVLLRDASIGLEEYHTMRTKQSRGRLAFRELGLAIGLASMERITMMLEANTTPPLQPVLAALHRFAPLRHEIESFWVRPDSQRTASWQGHRNINEVMLATSLLGAWSLDL